MIEVKVRGVTYCIPEEIWTVACETFRQQYARGVKVVPLARRISAELMPASFDDPFSQERLTRCLLSHFGKKGGKKKLRVSLPHQDTQLTLFGGA